VQLPSSSYYNAQSENSFTDVTADEAEPTNNIKILVMTNQQGLLTNPKLSLSALL